MARTTRFSQVLWSLTLAWLVGCGRIDFQTFASSDAGKLPDAAAQDAPTDTTPPIGPVVKITVPTMTTECGNTPGSYQIMIANTGDQPFVITKLTGKQNVVVTNQATGAVVVVPSFTVQVGSLPLTVGPGTAATLTVTPPAAVVGTDVGATTKAGSFTVETDAGMTPQVDLAATVVGANITITAPAGATSIDLMSSGPSCPTRAITIGNSGNATAQVTVTVSSGLGLTGFISGMVAQTRTTTLRPITSSQCSASGMTMQYQVTGIVCQQPPVLSVSYEMGGASTCSCS